ncbi:MAG: VanZ family protein [Acidobacteria bacterium]|nr:VanZ family protein [Acidobacteriota bacterium]
MKRLVLEYWTPLVVWLVAIFLFSTDTFSSAETSRIIVPFLKFLFPGLSPDDLQTWHGVLRKIAHVAAYFILAVFAYRSLKYGQSDLVQPKVRAMVFVASAALLDEFHQGFTVSRGASIVDVGYDCLGAVWALWLITAYETRRLRPYSVL